MLNCSCARDNEYSDAVISVNAWLLNAGYWKCSILVIQVQVTFPLVM